MDEKLISTDAEQEPKIWGFWASFGFSIVICLVFFLSQVFVSVLFVIANKLGVLSLDLSSLESNGILIGSCVFVSGILSSGVLLFFVFLKAGTSIKDYLKLYRVKLKDILFWVIVFIGFVIITDTIAYFTKGQIVPEVVHKQYESVGFFLPLFLFSIIIVAPIFEELFFRGFLFEPIRNTKLGKIGAVLITSIFWSVIHFQYDIFGVGLIFFFGILLGITKIKTNSLYPTIILHVLMNTIATSECIIINEFLR